MVLAAIAYVHGDRPNILRTGKGLGLEQSKACAGHQRTTNHEIVLPEEQSFLWGNGLIAETPQYRTQLAHIRTFSPALHAPNP